MPVSLGRDKDGCFARWGKKGAKYHYECGNETSRLNARKKAIAQGVAIGEFVDEKISFDFDGVLTTSKGKDLIKKYIDENNIVYIISARSSKDGLLKVANEVGVPESRVFATGSNKAKVEKIKELNISSHFDNNPDVIAELGNIGKIFK